MNFQSVRSLSLSSSFLGTRKFSVTQFFSAGLVNDGARFGDALALRYIPGFSGGAHQHQAGTGARFPQGIEETLYGVRAVGVLIAIFFVARSLDHANALPVGVQLVGHDHWQPGAVAAAHF